MALKGVTCFIGVAGSTVSPSVISVDCIGVAVMIEEAGILTGRSLISFNRVNNLFSTGRITSSTCSSLSLVISGRDSASPSLTGEPPTSSRSIESSVSSPPRQTYPNIRRIVLGGTIETTVESPASSSPLLGVEIGAMRLTSTLCFLLSLLSSQFTSDFSRWVAFTRFSRAFTRSNIIFLHRQLLALYFIKLNSLGPFARLTMRILLVQKLGHHSLVLPRFRLSLC